MKIRYLQRKKGNGIKYELVTWGIHHRNLSEKEIHTFKVHLKYFYVEWTTNSHLPCMKVSYHKHKCKWTYYGRRTWIQKYQNMCTSTDHLIPIAFQWHHYGATYKSTKPPIAEHRGHPNLSVGGTWELPQTNISAKMYGLEKQVPKEYQKQSTSNTNI